MSKPRQACLTIRIFHYEIPRGIYSYTSAELTQKEKINSAHYFKAFSFSIFGYKFSPLFMSSPFRNKFTAVSQPRSL